MADGVSPAQAPRVQAPDPDRAIADAELLAAVADAVLPGELARAEREAFAAAFARWVAGFRPGALISYLLPYAPPAQVAHGDHPARRYNDELAAIDRAARERHGAPLAGLPEPTRRELVRDAVAAADPTLRVAELGAHQYRRYEDHHVAVALLIFFMEEPLGVDIMYGRALRCFEGAGMSEAEPDAL